MPLSHFDFCQGTSRHITTPGLKLRGQLFLGKAPRFPDAADVLSNEILKFLIHLILPVHPDK